MKHPSKLPVPAIVVNLNVVEVGIDKVELWKDNPRKNDAAVPKLAALLKARGQVTPVVVWSKNNVCYKGNATIRAMKSLGLSTIKVLYADFPSEAAAIAYGISDNKSSEWSEWDDDVLSGLLKSNLSLSESSGLGFTQKDLNTFKMFQAMPDKLDNLGIEGDIPTLGDFLVVQFDSTESLDVFKNFLGMKKQERAINFDELKQHIKGL